MIICATTFTLLWIHHRIIKYIDYSTSIQKAMPKFSFKYMRIVSMDSMFSCF